MPARIGQCNNYSLCDRADSKELFAIAPGNQFVCPECGNPLRSREAPRPESRAWLFMGVLTGVVVTAVLFFVWSMFQGKLVSRVSGNSGRVILRLSGSNTIGAALGPALAETFLRQSRAS
jgi:phosphate transport system substrate-binding protein